MKLPFTIEQFLEIFKQYNLAIWPAQILAFLLGVLIVGLAFQKDNLSNRIQNGILSLLWIWNGVAYHVVFFSRINPTALLFGGLFILQGLLFLYSGVIRTSLSFKFQKDLPSSVGVAFILYGLVVYNFIGPMFGHGYPQSPMFGVAPCPTTIFTLGLFLWAGKKSPRFMIIIPVVWAVIGTFAAVNLGIREDFGLILAALASTIFMFWRKKERVPRNQVQAVPAGNR